MGNPHILVVPYPAQGHVIPIMELSQSLVKHGIRITFVNTEHNHKRVMNSMAAKEDGIRDQVGLVSIPDGPEFQDNMDRLEQHIEQVYRFMPEKVKELIEQINASDSDKITCVVADNLLGWAMEIAAEKGIKRAAFSAAAATLLVLSSSIPKLFDQGIIDNDGIPTKKQMFQLTPAIPAMNTAHFGWTCVGNEKVQKLLFGNMVRNNISMKLTDWVLCNSSYSLEPAAFDTDPKIRPVGPLLASNRFGDTTGNFWPEDSTCLKWLDQQQSQSVMYVAFGSTTSFDQTQFQELAMGLELCNRPFLWVMRPGAYPAGFQNRVGANGLIVNWAPQQKVLEHQSVACFVSHCGWNSTMEGVSNGIPFLCWPYFADQFHNKSYLCDVWKVGLVFNRDKRGIITRDEIKAKVEQLLENYKYKANALNLKEKVMNSIKDGESYCNFMNFVDWVKS